MPLEETGKWLDQEQCMLAYICVNSPQISTLPVPESGLQKLWVKRTIRGLIQEGYQSGLTCSRTGGF